VATPGPPVATEAQRRLLHDLVGWGEPRPHVPDGLVARARGALDAAAAEHAAATELLGARDPRPLTITKTRLSRLVCDGLQLDPEPYTHSLANARGTLAHAAIEDDLGEGRHRDPAEVVASSWHRLASDRPGDPASLSAWLNAQGPDERAELVAEVVALVGSFREVWPELGSAVALAAERRISVELAGGTVRLWGVPDLVLSSPREDDRARALVVDLKTGMPRPQQDRDELRFYALLHALATGRPPFRWATLYVTEGRHEAEDLDEALIDATVRRVVDAIVQAVRLLPFERARRSGGDRVSGVEDGVVIVAGQWCRGCRRAEACDVRSRALSDPDGMLEGSGSW
jgi:hypothetical protein